MSKDESRASIHEGGSGRRNSFISDYTVASGNHAATASVEIPDTIEGPTSFTGKRRLEFDNPDYEAFPPEEGGQGVIFHRTRPKISGWYGTGNALLNGEALAGAVNQSIKHSGMFPRRDSTLSKTSGSAVANFINKPEIKDSSDFLGDTNAKTYGEGVARSSAAYADAFLGENSVADTYRGPDSLRKATDEERSAAKGALRELPKYKKIYSAMEEGRQWDPNSISAFRDRAAKGVAEPKPRKVKSDPNQLKLNLSQ